jgi:hypothetical protein
MFRVKMEAARRHKPEDLDLNLDRRENVSVPIRLFVRFKKWQHEGIIFSPSTVRLHD